MSTGAQVSGGVTCLEHGKLAGILLGVWMVHIAELKVKLKASMTLISSKLEPNLVLRNDFVPRESCLCPVIVLNDTMDLNLCIFCTLTMLLHQIPYFCYQVWNIHKWHLTNLFSTSIQSFCECTHLSNNVLAYNGFGEGTLFPFTGNGNAQCLQPPIEVSFV